MTTLLPLAIYLLALSPGHAPTGLLVGMDRALSRTARERGLYSAFKKVLSPTARVFDPGMLDSAKWLDGLDHKLESQIYAEPSRAEASRSGDIGYTSGSWTLVKGKEYSSGAYLSIWRREKKVWHIEVFASAPTDFPEVPSGKVFFPARPLASPLAATKAPDVRSSQTAGYVADLRAVDSGTLPPSKYFPDAFLLRRDAAIKVSTGVPGDTIMPVVGKTEQLVSAACDFAVTLGPCSFNGEAGAYVRVWRRTPEGWRVSVEFAAANGRVTTLTHPTAASLRLIRRRTLSPSGRGTLMRWPADLGA